jgi:hypothetical protein
VESAVGLTLFSVVGYALLLAVDVGHNSQRVVMNLAEEDRALRASTSVLIDELASSSDGTITVTELADGNHCLRFMLPIEAGGVATWGVYERGVPELNWSVQYTVRSTVEGPGDVRRELVRQVVDDLGAVQRTDLLAENLRSGTQDPPGFRVVQNGAMREVTLSTDGLTDGKAGIEEVFHVRTRN